MSRYAEGTTVSPERSQAEIAELLRKYGATAIVTGFEEDRAVVAFRVSDRTVRFVLHLPTPGDFTVTPGRQRRTPAAAQAAHQAELRRLWRALLLVIKAKLELTRSGIATFEDEFLAYTVLPDNSTVGQHVQAEIEAAWKAGHAPARLLQIGRA